MIYKIGNLSLNTPEHQKIGISTKKMITPHQVVPWRDVAETCRTLDAICSEIETKNKKPFIVDGIARAGFWSIVFRNRWPGCSLLLNEADDGCFETLKKNFPKDKIFHKDIHKWVPEQCDISFLDFDHFSLRIISEWENVLKKWSVVSDKLAFVDSACFGFKFGNMKHYGVKKEEEYYYLLDETTRKITNKRITVVSKFINAAAILLENKNVKKIKFVNPSSLFLSRGGIPFGKKIKKGLFDL